MRSATIEDVKKAQESGKLEENVMYRLSCIPEVYEGVLVHGKRCVHFLASMLKNQREFYGKQIALGETAEGEVQTVDLQHIHPLSTGVAQQPKKPRKKPIRGTKPEKLIPMSADVSLMVGDKVVLADGSRVTVLIVDGTETPYFVDDGWFRGWFDTCGEYILGGERITHKVVPYAEQIRTPEAVKSPEQAAFEKGYWVAHQAKPDSRVPPFAVGWRIDYLMRSMESYRAEYAENLRWNMRNNGADIVAYRKAPNQ